MQGVHEGGRGALHVAREVLEQTGAHEQRVDELVHGGVDERLHCAVLVCEAACEAVPGAEVDVPHEGPARQTIPVQQCLISQAHLHTVGLLSIVAVGHIYWVSRYRCNTLCATVHSGPTVQRLEFQHIGSYPLTYTACHAASPSRLPRTSMRGFAVRYVQ